MLGIHEVQTRLAELDKIIENAEVERVELRHLADLLEKYEPKLAPGTALETAVRAVEMATGGPVKIKTENTSDVAYKVLADRGELHIDRIIEFMRQAGWQGSGTPRKDYKNIHHILVTKPGRFRRGTEPGYFKLTKEAKK